MKASYVRLIAPRPFLTGMNRDSADHSKCGVSVVYFERELIRLPVLSRRTKSNPVVRSWIMRRGA
jgi:hypothetical protein